MPLTLHIDGPRWRSHLRTFTDTHLGIIPVAKGNGYGFGMAALARRCDWLGVDTMAVGTYEEAPGALTRFDGDVLVLTPWRPFIEDIPEDPRLIHTVGRIEDIAELASRPGPTRVVVEGLTSMNRHGLTRHQLAAAADQLGGLQLEGFAVHLPMEGSRLDEAEEWGAVLEASRLETTKLHISHLTDKELAQLRERRPNLRIRPRIGTALWLGDRGSLHVTGTLLDRHRITRGERIGYRQRPMPRDGWLLIVSGGTAHGIGMEAPTAATTMRQRAISVARGSLEAAGFAYSPFSIGGKQRWFAEPPHMQASLLFLPSGVEPPEIGDEISVDVRYTTTMVDRVEIS
jgi:Alanine racemase, N-terminal domain